MISSYQSRVSSGPDHQWQTFAQEQSFMSGARSAVIASGVAAVTVDDIVEKSVKGMYAFLTLRVEQF
jgi:hypothetical protein